MNATDMNKPSKTDWARIDGLADDAIDTSDIPPLTEDQFTRMSLRLPVQTGMVTDSVDQPSCHSERSEESEE